MKLKVFTLSLLCLCVFSVESKAWKEGSAEWKTVPVPKASVYETAFNSVLDYVSSDCELDLVDMKEGYIRTGWSPVKTKKGKSIKDLRKRITLNFNYIRTNVQVRVEVQKDKHGTWIAGEDPDLTKKTVAGVQGAIGY